LQSLRVELRRLDFDQGTAHARLLVDQVDDHGLLSRSTIELAETWEDTAGEPLLVRNEDEIVVSAERRSALFRLTSSDAETTLTELAAQPGITVARVTRGTIGPFCLAELPAAIPFGALVKGPRGGFATFALEVAASELARDASNDPLPHLLLESLSGAAAGRHDQSRLRLGYRVYRDRKFVSDLASLPVLERLCRSAGTRNIIYITALGGCSTEVSP
jgi:hypothetical protein